MRDPEYIKQLSKLAVHHLRITSSPRRFSMEQEQWIQRLAVVCNADFAEIIAEYERKWFDMEFMYDQVASGRVLFVDGRFVLNQHFCMITANRLNELLELMAKENEGKK